MPTNQKQVQVKLTRGLLDVIVLQFLKEQPMHGYELINRIRKVFGVYFGASTIYPLLSSFEKQGLISSVWSMVADKPRKIYELTDDGRALLGSIENSLSILIKQLGSGLIKGAVVKEQTTPEIASKQRLHSVFAP